MSNKQAIDELNKLIEEMLNRAGERICALSVKRDFEQIKSLLQDEHKCNEWNRKDDKCAESGKKYNPQSKGDIAYSVLMNIFFPIFGLRRFDEDTEIGWLVNRFKQELKAHHKIERDK